MHNLRYLVEAAAALGLLLAQINPSVGAEQRALITPAGDVMACFGDSGFIYGPDCQGPARVEVMAPVKDGAIEWRTGNGLVVKDASLSCTDTTRVVRSPEDETVFKSDRMIKILDSESDEVTRLIAPLIDKGFVDTDIKIIFSAFVDLKGSGSKDIILIGTTIAAAQSKFETEHADSKWYIKGYVFSDNSSYPVVFLSSTDIYRGGTDSFDWIDVVGFTRLDAMSSSITLVVDKRSGLSRTRTFVRLPPERGLFLIEAYDLDCM
jgi:hypothetical protein